jgi:ribonuclease R
VQVSRVDLDGRKIDFRMVRDVDEDAALMRARRDAWSAAPPRRPSSRR